LAANGEANLPGPGRQAPIRREGGSRATEIDAADCVEGGAIQRVAIVTGPGFYDPHLTPESIAENYAQVEVIEGFSEPSRFEPGIGDV
jgi:hypothetical protein